MTTRPENVNSLPTVDATETGTISNNKTSATSGACAPDPKMSGLVKLKTPDTSSTTTVRDVKASYTRGSVEIRTDSSLVKTARICVSQSDPSARLDQTSVRFATEEYQQHTTTMTSTAAFAHHSYTSVVPVARTGSLLWKDVKRPAPEDVLPHPHQNPTFASTNQ